MSRTRSAAPGQPLIGERHRLGHAMIDGDHFAIAEAWRRAMQCDALALPFHIARLRKLMRSHFDREAALVEAAGRAFCRCHRREHEAMLALCDAAYARAADHGRSARALLRRALPRLMRAHVDGMDQITVLLLRSAEQDGLPAPATPPRPPDGLGMARR